MKAKRIRRAKELAEANKKRAAPKPKAPKKAPKKADEEEEDKKDDPFKEISFEYDDD